jgi:hypothetical protein
MSAMEPDGSSRVTGARWKNDSARPIWESVNPRDCRKMIQMAETKLNSLTIWKT